MAPVTITEITAGSGLNSLESASTRFEHGRVHFNNWGSADQVLEAIYVPSVTGKYVIQVVYGNAFNMVNTGITACVKNIEVIDSFDHLVASNVVVMPHLLTWDTCGDSSFARASLTAGVPCKIRIKDFYNMSYLARNATYNYAGGLDGPVNRANISGLKILRMEQT